MNGHYDIAVVGAGPAGSVAAYLAAKRGLDVLLLERASFPRFKVCGCCLNARALRILDNLGMAGLPQELGALPLRSLDVRAPGRRASLGLSGSVSVSRSRLDTALVWRATLAGARFLDATAATMGAVEGSSRRLHLRRSGRAEETVRAGVVLVTDGLSGTSLRHHPRLAGRVASRSRVGAAAILDVRPPECPPDAVTLVCARGGYAGLVAIEDGRLNVAAALDRDAMLGGPGESVARILEQNGMSEIHGLADADWRGTPALTRTRRVVAGERFFVLGDAAGYVEPFTGEGIAWAVEAAAMASDLFCGAARDWNPSHARTWSRRYRTLVRRRRWGCRMVAGILRRPRLTRALIGACGRNPELVRPFVRHLTQPSPTGSGGAA